MIQDLPQKAQPEGEEKSSSPPSHLRLHREFSEGTVHHRSLARSPVAPAPFLLRGGDDLPE